MCSRSCFSVMIQPGESGRRELLSAPYAAFARRAGKPRWGDNTPQYVRHLETPHLAPVSVQKDPFAPGRHDQEVFGIRAQANLPREAAGVIQKEDLLILEQGGIAPATRNPGEATVP